jgi:hypothetical protein
VVAALNSSVQFNKHNFWIDPKSHNQYYVGVQYPETDIKDLETLLDIPITSADQRRSIPLRNLVKLPVQKVEVPSEVFHTNLQPTIDLTMGVHGRDLGHVAADVERVVAGYGQERPDGGWTPFDPGAKDKTPMEGARLTLSGEYQKMQDTFRFQAMGMVGAVILIYFLMVALFRSYVTPLVVMSAVPVGVTGVVLMLYFTGTALNVQSLLGVIFMVGIVVSNTVLLTDFAENVRKEERLTPLEAIKRAAGIRVRPVVMTALATFFALIPMSLGLSRGSEANVPLGRAVLGGLLAGLATTLLVVPCVYSLLVRDRVDPPDEPLPGEPGYVPGRAVIHSTAGDALLACPARGHFAAAGSFPTATNNRNWATSKATTARTSSSRASSDCRKLSSTSIGRATPGPPLTTRSNSSLNPSSAAASDAFATSTCRAAARASASPSRTSRRTWFSAAS